MNSKSSLEREPETPNGGPGASWTELGGAGRIGGGWGERARAGGCCGLGGRKPDRDHADRL